MDELTNIASGKPGMPTFLVIFLSYVDEICIKTLSWLCLCTGNILAAHKVASSLSEAVVNAIVERSMEALPKRCFVPIVHIVLIVLNVGYVSK